MVLKNSTIQKRSDEYYTQKETVQEVLKYVDLTGLKLYAPCDKPQSAFNDLKLAKRTSDDFRSHSFKGYTIITNPPFSLIAEFYKKCKQEADHFLFIAPLTFLSRKGVPDDIIRHKINVFQTQGTTNFINEKGTKTKINTIWVTDLPINQKVIPKPKPKPKPLKIKGTSYLNFDLTEVFIKSDYEVGAVPISALVGKYRYLIEPIKFLRDTQTEDGKNKFFRYLVRKKTKNEH